MLHTYQPSGEGVAPDSGGRVMIIDDEESVRAVLVRMVARLGFSVCEADDGPAGLAALGEAEGDLVALLVDMTMPHMSGVDVARAALAMRPGLPVVLMSGHPSESLVRDHGLAGQVRFLQKPFTYTMVRDLLCRGA
ncbi:response regulator [Oscillochloris sp. ZM17-4]|uniref:response regulator n=1 Tax=Oscillochloris sp. ZM17-4 TaxID=2866714 RepID=UPI001C739DB9|nr:response regulator [Oscillochloris sp. ZM17-4]MBX0328042.1 response regulator [Oscillochloris sp. ZM17-4]